MISIKYKSNFEKKLKELDPIKKIYFEDRKNSLRASGAFLTVRVRDYIESNGDGNWQKTHPLTLQASKETAFFWLGKMARYTVNFFGNKCEIGFGTFSKRDVKKSRGLRFDRNLQKISYTMQRGKVFKTTKRMQRKLGAGRKKKTDIPGINFFPIKNATNSLKIPARPTMKPVLQKFGGRAGEIFAESLAKNFTKSFERL